MRLFEVVAPTVEPITMAQVRNQVRKEADESDPDFDAQVADVVIPAVRDRAELATRRQMNTATWDLKLDAFPSSYIEVPRPPLLTVVSITYVDPSGATQTWAADEYQVSAPSGPRCARGRIAPAYGVCWPSTRNQLDAVTVRFTCGYGSAPDDVPALLRAAMLLDAGTLLEHREDVITGPIVVELPRSAKVIYRSFKSRPTRR